MNLKRMFVFIVLVMLLVCSGSATSMNGDQMSFNVLSKGLNLVDRDSDWSIAEGTFVFLPRWAGAEVPSKEDIHSGGGVPVASGASNQSTAAIDGDRVVWIEDGGDSLSGNRVILCNFSSGETTTIANTSEFKHSLRFEGTRIVWSTGKIWIHDLVSGLTAPITNDSLSAGTQKNPDISGQWVVWEEYENFSGSSPDNESARNADIVIYDLMEQRIEQITDDYYYQGYPCIAGESVVWVDGRGYPDVEDTEIYLYDIRSKEERQITNDSIHQLYPAVSNDRIVWVEFSYPFQGTADGRNQSSAMLDICLYNITTGEKSVISAGEITFSDMEEFFVHWRLSIFGDSIVWQDRSAGNWDIYLHTISSGTTTQITTDTAAQRFPDVAESRIVWEDNRSGNWEIWVFDIDEEEVTTEATPIPATIAPAPSSTPPPPIITPVPTVIPYTPPPIITPVPTVIPYTPPPIITPMPTVIPYTPPPTPPPVYTPPPMPNF